MVFCISLQFTMPLVEGFCLKYENSQNSIVSFMNETF